MTHYFANVLYLSICMLGNCLCHYIRLLTFFKIKFLKINHTGPPSECHTVWIQIKTDILLVFIWVQNVCKRLLANDKIIHWHAKSYNRFCFCFCCFTSHVNSYGHCGTVSSLNHTFSWAGLSKRLTSNLCTYFRL